MRVNVRTKLALAFAFIILLRVLGYHAMVSSSRDISALYTHNVQAAVQLANAEQAMWQLRYGEAQYVALTGEARHKIPGEETKWRHQVEENMNSLAAGDRTADEKQLVATWNDVFAKYMNARPHWFELQGAGKIQEAAEFRARTILPCGALAVDTLAKLSDLQNEQGRARLSASLAHVARMRVLLAGILLFCLFAAVAVSLEEIREWRLYEKGLIRARDDADSVSIAKSRFLADMSHEIRTPMNGVIGMIQLLMQTELTPEQREYAGVAQTSGRNLLSLIDHILDLSKIEAGKISLENRSFNLPSMVSDLVQPLSVQATAKGLGIRSSVSPTLRSVSGDAHRLRQVLDNLMANAIKFTAQGEVSLDVRLESEHEGKVTIRFAVTDTGIGIKSENAATLFSPFTQAEASTTRKYGGTGLGLSICKQLVEMMGGKIALESKEGEGSTFFFTLIFNVAIEEAAPEVSISGLQVDADAKSNPPIQPSGLRILLAEDNRVNQMFATMALERMGHTIVLAQNGREAVSLLSDQSFDLVLMDIQMPEMDGLTATSMIRAQEKVTQCHIPILAMTANAMVGDRELCLDAGMDGYISKPIGLKELKSAIANVLLSRGKVEDSAPLTTQEAGPMPNLQA
jgi:signal transduction histidine kinase/ActR/RegA family two-component response regulator